MRKIDLFEGGSCWIKKPKSELEMVLIFGVTKAFNWISPSGFSWKAGNGFDVLVGLIRLLLLRMIISCLLI